MSLSGRRLAAKSTSRRSSNLTESQINALPHLARGFAKAGRLFALEPLDARLPNTIPYGLYSYIQLRQAPQTIYLMPTNSYLSLHSKQASFLGLVTADLLSAGEMVIGSQGQVAAWSFRTGSYYSELGLENPDLKGPLMAKVGLPLESFYSVDDWVQFKDGGVNYFAEFFTTYGFIKTIDKPTLLMPSVKAVEENIYQQREERDYLENAVKERLHGALQNLYQVLQANRDEYELMKKPLAKTEMPRSASSGRVDEAVRKVDVIDPKLKSQSERMKVRTLDAAAVGSSDEPSFLNSVNVASEFEQSQTSDYFLESGRKESNEMEAWVGFEKLPAVKVKSWLLNSPLAPKSDLMIASGQHKKTSAALASTNSSSRAESSFDVARWTPESRHTIANFSHSDDKPSVDFFESALHEAAQQRTLSDEVSGPASLALSPVSPLLRAQFFQPALAEKQITVVDQNEATCCLPFGRWFGSGKK